MGSEVKIACDVDHAVKRFGEGERSVTALDGVSVEIRHNEFFTLLGPSGCGKTTLLRLVAGFEELTSGIIRLYGEEIGALPPNKRPINTVFQHYALFPHMTVAENVAFGLLRLRHEDDAVRLRVADMLELVQMAPLANRKPAQLSGGQQQRVALARALAPAPKLLLLDEPLSALDLKLRQAMRVELKQLQENTGITFIFVTHDQDEALSMSDRIAVMSVGRIQQIGRPDEIYETPVNKFVADFIGDTNLIAVKVEKLMGGGKLICRSASGLTFTGAATDDVRVGETKHASIRPERIRFVNGSAAEAAIDCEIVRTIYLGNDVQRIVKLSEGTMLTVRGSAAESNGNALSAGSRARLVFDAEGVRVLSD